MITRELTWEDSRQVSGYPPGSKSILESHFVPPGVYPAKRHCYMFIVLMLSPYSADHLCCGPCSSTKVDVTLHFYAVILLH